MLRLVIFLIGFCLSVIGFTFCLVYLNLTTIGYNFIEYVQFIISRFECCILIVGLITMYFSLLKEDNNEICL